MINNAVSGYRHLGINFDADSLHHYRKAAYEYNKIYAYILYIRIKYDKYMEDKNGKVNESEIKH